jgi:hypothetical protein
MDGFIVLESDWMIRRLIKSVEQFQHVTRPFYVSISDWLACCGLLFETSLVPFVSHSSFLN